ncbi:MAG: cofactor-independent phosphoglycerate mutase [Clostridia bacterium]|nr:cofactor-independent phosphoglycerate mutase [Clostridia bacterium]
MKYIVMLGDGMADHPVEALGGKTPLSAAVKPNMDYIARKGIVGLINTVPEGMVPESDTANLAVMGYDPRVYSKGRSPLEAASMGIIMRDDETAIRANVVTLGGDGDYDDLVMIDHSSGEISTEEARQLIEAVQEEFGTDYRRFYTGVSYRHCVIWRDCPDFTDFSRPHDIIGKRIGDHLPRSESSRPMLELMRDSYKFLSKHPVNLKRVAEGKRPANSLWLWSPGKKPSLPSFKGMTGLDASVVCAVDLIKGIGVCAGMKVPSVKGATGALNTDYAAKRDAALNELANGADLVYIHVEAPDECGHQGDPYDKIRSIENIDKYILQGLIDELRARGERFRILLMPDHPTPVAVRTHTREPVPFAIYDSGDEKDSGVTSYDEETVKSSGIFFTEGGEAMKLLLKADER